jgi:hypothetical protein
MKRTVPQFLLTVVFLIAVFFPGRAFPDYVEGIDTTDANGFGLDSAFQVSYGFIGGRKAQSLAYYVYGGCGCDGFFPYNFDDITMAPNKVWFPGRNNYVKGENLFNCFTMVSTKDSTYSKVQFLQQVSGNEYVFRYGINTTPKDRSLIKSGYNRSEFYKPNNFVETFYNHSGTIADTIAWDPPLPSNNHLLGYVFYFTKRLENLGNVDTTAPVNMAQWDSLTFYDTSWVPFSTALQDSFFYSIYYRNLVAVYAEGRSSFLSGWSKHEYQIVDTKTWSRENGESINKMQVTRSGTGYSVRIRGFSGKTSSISLLSLLGQEVFRLTTIGDRSVFLSTSNRSLREGLYILRAELPDKTVLTRTFMFTR